MNGFPGRRTTVQARNECRRAGGFPWAESAPEMGRAPDVFRFESCERVRRTEGKGLDR